MIDFFKDTEFFCKGRNCGCEHNVSITKDFRIKLNILRYKCGFPFIISSGYRCPVHNKAVAKTGDAGPHTTGRAVDIKVYGADTYLLLKEVFSLGFFNGVGIKQHGSVGSRYVHIDDLTEEDGFPRPRVFSY